MPTISMFLFRFSIVATFILVSLRLSHSLSWIRRKIPEQFSHLIFQQPKGLILWNLRNEANGHWALSPPPMLMPAFSFAFLPPRFLQRYRVSSINIKNINYRSLIIICWKIILCYISNSVNWEIWTHNRTAEWMLLYGEDEENEDDEDVAQKSRPK